MIARETKTKAAVTGNGTISGGVYDSVKILGESIIHGEVSCGTFKCTGNCAVEGALDAKEIRLTGEVTVNGLLRSQDLKAVGHIRVDGSVYGGDLTIRGMLNAEGDCEGDRLELKGAFEIGGLLNAERIDVSLYGPCRVKEIGGGTLSVRRRTLQKLKQWFTSDGPAELKAGVIEGDDIYLEHTNAEAVRGKRIVIGPGCKIGLVEYTSELQIHKASVVAREVHLT